VTYKVFDEEAGNLLCDPEVRWLLDNREKVILQWTTFNSSAGGCELVRAPVCECIRKTKQASIKTEGRDISDAKALVKFIVLNSAKIYSLGSV
jgi:hypothetical protein